MKVGGVVGDELAEFAGEFERGLEVWCFGADDEEGVDGEGAFRVAFDEV